MTAAIDADVYIAALTVDEIFADPTYQRVLDVRRARKMTAAWDRRLAGILEVSDRGEGASPRFAVLDGQHRWAAAKFLQTPPSLVANVHSGLSVADEAALFDQLNRQRKQTGTWDHWRARRVSGDEQVLAIEAVACKHSLRIDVGPVDGYIGCTTTLEKIVKLGGTELLDDVLLLVTKSWGARRDGFDSPIVHGIALVLFYLNSEIDGPLLAESLMDVLPRQIRAQAAAMKEITTGTMPTLTAIAIMSLYNKKPGRRILVSNRTFGGGSINARSASKAAT